MERQRLLRKRRTLARLDDESSLGSGPTSGGKTSSIVAVVPPNQYPKAIWGKLVEQGKLKCVDQGLYQLATT